MRPPYLFPLLSGCLTVLLIACAKEPPPAQAQKPPPEVTVVRAVSESVPLTHETVGLLAPVRVAQVRARVAGIVLKRAYTEGTDVKQGQILFQIDPAPFEADLHTVEAEYSRARASATNAALIAKRYLSLVADKLIAPQDLDTAQANERTTAALVRAARANVEKARLNLGYATVMAPIAGRAGRSLVTEGALVGKDEATQLATIEQIDPIYVNFSQAASNLQQLQQTNEDGNAAGTAPAGISVQITLPDGTPYPYPGTVDFSDLAVDQRTGTVPLRAVIPNQERRLLPGMFVTLQVTTGHLDNAFLLPQATVLRDHTGAYVLVVDATGRVRQHRVQTHGMTRTHWIVSGDLAEGDQVILDGLQKVKPGSMAKAASAAPSLPASAVAVKP